MAKGKHYFFWLFLFLSTLSYAATPKILSIQNTASTLIIKFNQKVDKNSFQFFHLKNIGGYRKNVYDIEGLLFTKPLEFDMEGEIGCKIAQYDKNVVRVVFSAKDRFYTASRNISKDTVEFRVTPGSSPQPGSRSETQEESKPKPKTITITPKENPSQPQLIQAKSKFEAKDKTVVIDPGHGGKDCGAYGINKVCEKKIVYEIAKYLNSELKKSGYKVYLTRYSDKFVKLRERTKYANKKNADVFVSIHANAVPSKSARTQNGIETYFLSNARSNRAKNVAALENKDDLEDMDYFAKETTLGILNNPRMVASNKLALDVQYAMLKSIKENYKEVEDGGVREGPFWVLVGAQMPSILVEVGYVTHASESRRLVNSAYQKKLAQGIAQGIDAYFRKNSN